MTIVTIRIEPVSQNRCRVRLEHTGWAIGDHDTEEFAYSQRSWKIVLRNLRSALTVRNEGTSKPTSEEQSRHRAPVP